MTDKPDANPETTRDVTIHFSRFTPSYWLTSWFPIGSVQVPSKPLLECPINVTDPSSYLDAVKVQFHGQPDVYNHFLDMVKDFKSGLYVPIFILLRFS
ncbi:uncharacterized protein EDB91DRAFT_1282050 [Suillus paluster]|uniref:uncharacterized protein n=1 Tax=Suillus paluster TaxID=48578 RepID=UPI001B88124E|nr:uncharacterized protein EDB91DRAFT_1282050 [Suillus paluster]KAG1720234.1 hypothetical protein EDB91DRAFT_1282050 [Suillus paluster]